MSRQFYNYIRKMKTNSFMESAQWFDISTTKYVTRLCRRMVLDWLDGDKRPIYKVKKLLEISEIDGYVKDTAAILLREFSKIMDNDPAIDKERQKLKCSVPRFLDYKYNSTLQKIYEIELLLPIECGEDIVNNSYEKFKTMLDINATELYTIAAKELYDMSQNRLILDNSDKYTTDELIDKVVTHLYTYSAVSAIGYCCITFKALAEIKDFLNVSDAEISKLSMEERLAKINDIFPELLTHKDDLVEIANFIFNAKPINDIGDKSIIDQLPTYVIEDKADDVIYLGPTMRKDVLVVNPRRDVFDHIESILDELCDKIMESDNAKPITRRIINYHRSANYVKDRIAHRVDSRLLDLLKTTIPSQRLSKINLCKERALQYQYENLENCNHAISQLLFDNLAEMVCARKEFYDIANKYYVNKNIINSNTPEESFRAMYYDGAAIYILYFLDEIANKLTNRWRA